MRTFDTRAIRNIFRLPEDGKNNTTMMETLFRSFVEFFSRCENHFGAGKYMTLIHPNDFTDCNSLSTFIWSETKEKSSRQQPDQRNTLISYICVEHEILFPLYAYGRVQKKIFSIELSCERIGLNELDKYPTITLTRISRQILSFSLFLWFGEVYWRCRHTHAYVRSVVSFSHPLSLSLSFLSFQSFLMVFTCLALSVFSTIEEYEHQAIDILLKMEILVVLWFTTEFAGRWVVHLCLLVFPILVLISIDDWSKH